MPLATAELANLLANGQWAASDHGLNSDSLMRTPTTAMSPWHSIRESCLTSIPPSICSRVLIICSMCRLWMCPQLRTTHLPPDRLPPLVRIGRQTAVRFRRSASAAPAACYRMERKVTEQVLSSQKNARRQERSGGLLDRLFERREKGLWSFLTWSFFLSQMVGAEQASAAAARSAGTADETASTNDADAGQAAGNAFLPPGPVILAEMQEAAAQSVQSLTQAAAPANVLAAPAEFAAPAEMRSTDEVLGCTADQRGRQPGGNSAGSPRPRSPSIRSLEATYPAWAVRPCPPSGFLRSWRT